MKNCWRVPVLLTIVMATSTVRADDTSSADVVRQLVTAYNNHDVDSMLVLFTDDIRWMSVADQQISLEAKGHEEMASAMHSFFQARPSTQSELRSVSAAGPFVTAIEEAFTLVDGKRRGQCAASVYEVNGRKIRNVWYFDAFACPAKSDTSQPTDN